MLTLRIGFYFIFFFFFCFHPFFILSSFPHSISFNLISLILFQLRKLAYAIKNSTTIILPRWNAIIEECAVTSTSNKKLTVRKMPRDVSTRWNSTFDMLKFACLYHDAINKITDDRSMKLCDYELKDHEWKIVEELRDSLKVLNLYIYIIILPYCLFLQIFKTVTLEFSTDTPSIANVIPAMDRMHADLLAACENEKYSTAIRAALKVGMNLLNKYYSITDNSEVYRIAISKSIMISIWNRLINQLFSSSPISQT